VSSAPVQRRTPFRHLLAVDGVVLPG